MGILKGAKRATAHVTALYMWGAEGAKKSGKERQVFKPTIIFGRVVGSSHLKLDI